MRRMMTFELWFRRNHDRQSLRDAYRNYVDDMRCLGAEAHALTYRQFARREYHSQVISGKIEG